MSGKKQASLDILFEVENMEREYELAFAETFFCGLGRVETVKWTNDVYGAWKKQIFNTSSWSKVWGLAGAVRCELRDVGVQLSA